MPTLFITHGSPALAVQDCAARRWLLGYAAELPRPTAILCITAHWETERPAVSGAVQPQTIYDFGSIYRQLYTLSYPAPGDPALAARTAQLLGNAGIACDMDPDRGFDHGAWVPGILLYPEAEIPMVQLSVQPGSSPAEHLAVGRALAPLRDEGVLILGSGSATHNLADLRRDQLDAPPLAYVRAFEDWLIGRVDAADADALCSYVTRAPEALHNHPTPDHILPLFAPLGAAMNGGTGSPGENIHTSCTYGVLAMTCFRWH